MPVADWTARLRELVEAGPVPFAVAQTEMARLVPPGRAFRDAQRYIEWSREKEGSQKVDGDLSDIEVDGRIRRGQMRMAYIAIWTQQKYGRVEVYEQDAQKMLRLGPNPWVAQKPKAKQPSERPSKASVAPKGTREHPRPVPERMASWTIRIWQRVASGPVLQDALIADAARLVPPGVAYREAERNAARLRARSGGKARNHRDEQAAKDLKIRSGSRSIVTRAISHAVKRGRLTRLMRDADAYVDRGPNFWIGTPPLDVSNGGA